MEPLTVDTSMVFTETSVAAAVVGTRLAGVPVTAKPLSELNSMVPMVTAVAPAPAANPGVSNVRVPVLSDASASWGFSSVEHDVISHHIASYPIDSNRSAPITSSASGRRYQNTEVGPCFHDGEPELRCRAEGVKPAKLPAVLQGGRNRAAGTDGGRGAA